MDWATVNTSSCTLHDDSRLALNTPAANVVYTMHRLRYAFTLLRHIIGFARENKVYWMVPMVLILGLLALVIFGGQAATPFIYSLW